MIIIEMAPYINGDLYTRECVPPVRCTPEMFAKVVKAPRQVIPTRELLNWWNLTRISWNFSLTLQMNFRCPNERRCSTVLKMVDIHLTFRRSVFMC